MFHVLKAVAASILLLLFLGSCAMGPSREQGMVSRALEAMGGADRLAGIKTVYVKGTTKFWEPEQSDVPGGEMRFANETAFEAVIDRASRSSRADYVRNFAYPAPRTFSFSEIVTPDAGYVIGVDSNGRNAQSMKATPPAHSMSGLRLAASQRELRRASLGALLLEMRANPDGVRSADITESGRSWPAASYQGFVVAFDPQTNLPARVRTLDYDNVWGDVNFDLVLGQWRAFEGVMVATSQKYELNGRMIQDTAIGEVRINGPVDARRLQIPAAVRATAAKPATGNVPYQWVIRRQFIGVYMDSDNVSYDTQGSQGLRLQEVAPGVHHLQGGTHHSMLVEMRDHLVVFDAPVTDAQSAWVVKDAKAKFPGKPIRHVVLTHHHMDHIGGLRGFLAEGATLVVGQGAAAHYRRVLASPSTRNPDLKTGDFSRTQIMEVANRQAFSDGQREVQAILMDSPHAKGTLMGYVPHAKIGFVTDI